MTGLDAGDFNGTERFVVQGRLGAGGHGVVYRTIDRERNIPVALKTLRVGVDEAGDHGSPAEVEDSRTGARLRSHVGVASHHHDALATDEQRVPSRPTRTADLWKSCGNSFQDE